MNRCYNKQGSRTNYIHSSISHCTKFWDWYIREEYYCGLLGYKKPCSLAGRYSLSGGIYSIPLPSWRRLYFPPHQR